MASLRRWSGVDRAERARRRAGAEAAPPEDGDNPLPEAIDPITLEPVVCGVPLNMRCHGHCVCSLTMLCTWVLD